MVLLSACARPADTERLGRRIDALGAEVEIERDRVDSLLALQERALRTFIAAAELRRDGDRSEIAELRAAVVDLDDRLDQQQSGLERMALTDSTGATSIEAAALFRQAYLDITRGEFELAREGFEQFLQISGPSPLVDDAWFWLGECLYAESRFAEALEAYRAVLRATDVEDHHPAALLRMGLCEIELDLRGDARATFNRLIDEFPDAQEARIAQVHLLQIEAP